MASQEEIRRNLDAVNDSSPLTEEELQAAAKIRDSLGTQFCRRCNYCAPCTVGISIPNVFLIEGYYSRYDLKDWAVFRYNNMEKKAEDCIGCGVCETRCPYHLPIRKMLKKAQNVFGK